MKPARSKCFAASVLAVTLMGVSLFPSSACAGTPSVGDALNRGLGGIVLLTFDGMITAGSLIPMGVNGHAIASVAHPADGWIVTGHVFGWTGFLLSAIVLYAGIDSPGGPDKTLTSFGAVGMASGAVNIALAFVANRLPYPRQSAPVAFAPVLQRDKAGRIVAGIGFSGRF